MKARELALEYFARMRARQPVDELFAPDGELFGLGNLVKGRAAIREFYAGAQSDAAPTPSEPLVLLADERHCAAEIKIALKNGITMHAMDLFEVADAQITRLSYFICDDPKDY